MTGAEGLQLASAVGSMLAGLAGLAVLFNKKLQSVADSILGTIGIRFDAVDNRLKTLEDGSRSLTERSATNSERIAKVEAHCDAVHAAHPARVREVRP